MKFKLAAVILAAFITLTACSSNQEKTHPPAQIATQNGPGPVAATFTEDDVEKLLKSSGLEFNLTKREGAWILNGESPTEFVVGYPNVKMAGPAHYVSIYIFKDVKESQKGLDDFNKQKEKYDMVVPSVWKNGNGIVFYWHSTPLGQKPAFEDQITQALTGWDIVYKHPTDGTGTKKID